MLLLRSVGMRAEHDLAFRLGATKVGYAPALYAKLKDHPTLKLDGNHDVFGAGAVVILSAPGHTPGRQSLLVRLPRQGFWINHDRAQSAAIAKTPGFVE